MVQSSKKRPVTMIIEDDNIVISACNEVVGTILKKEFERMTVHEIMDRVGLEIRETY